MSRGSAYVAFCRTGKDMFDSLLPYIIISAWRKCNVIQYRGIFSLVSACMGKINSTKHKYFYHVSHNRQICWNLIGQILVM